MGDAPDPAAIQSELRQYLIDNVLDDSSGFEFDTPLSEAGVDSFALVEMLLFAERRFGVAVPESQLTPENLATVAAMARCIHHAASAAGEEAI